LGADLHRSWNRAGAGLNGVVDGLIEATHHAGIETAGDLGAVRCPSRALPRGLAACPASRSLTTPTPTEESPTTPSRRYATPLPSR
jgi:hypothetical protein